MTASYEWVQWNRHKKAYDAIIAAACVAFLLVYLLISIALRPADQQISPPIIAMRALGSLAIILLHLILIIGPLARLTDLVAPILYNRRHLGVTLFLVVLLHAIIALGFYGGFGVRNPALALLAPPGSFASLSAFPFEVFGFVALLILFMMAATSHDFWLKHLHPRIWKSLHMLVYFAYALVLAHVALGPAMDRGPTITTPLLLAGAAIVATLHLLAARREWKRDHHTPTNPANTPPATPHATADQWLDVAAIDEIAPNAAKVVCLKNHERIAIFRHDNGYSAVTNLCAHQNGPLGEGRIINGCITCPWHGYQYRPHDGQSPPPYTERIATYNIRIEGQRILINPTPNPPGTPVPPPVPDTHTNTNTNTNTNP
ncbi:MAG: Rieske 2Fe-2S domain-containing protein [Phycisphaerales bacterium]